MKSKENLAKKLKKLYWKNGQRFYVTIHCLFNKKNDFRADVYATNKKGEWLDGIYLFEIMTLSCFDDFIIRPKKHYFRDYKLVKTQNYAEIAHIPLYINEIFTLKKFGNITKNDIRSCVDYFMHEILDTWWCWNIKVILEYEKRRKKCK